MAGDIFVDGNGIALLGARIEDTLHSGRMERDASRSANVR